MTSALAPDLVTMVGQSALRSLLLGAVVLAGLRLARLRDLRAETAIWTAVLLAAVAMPLLAALLPRVSLSLPALGPAPASGPALTGGSGEAGRHWRWPAPSVLLAALYAAGVAIGLARILFGLALVMVLYRRARPVPEPWARGRAIRVSEAVSGPLSFARCILLPADYPAWPSTKLAAVLAHEECHIRRGDFFIQLLASLHRALFWFSPFPWWLQSKLGELAETASDAAGAQRIGDAAGYAEILIDVTRAAHRRRRMTPAPALAMAHGPALALRVDHLLAASPERSLGTTSKLVALAAVAAASLGLAAVHTALAEARLASDAGRAPNQGLPAPSARQPLSASAPRPTASRRPRARRPDGDAARRTGVPAKAPPADVDQPSYDPLALVRDNDTVAVLPVILTSRGVARAAND